MTKLPYGGVDLSEDNIVHGKRSLYGENRPEMPPWERLEEIALAFEDAEQLDDGRLAMQLAPALAEWMGKAILRSRGKPQSLLVELGLKRSRGNPGRPFEKWSMQLAERIIEIEEAEKTSTEDAVRLLLEEWPQRFAEFDKDYLECPSEGTLKRYRREYVEAMKAK